MLGQDLGLFHLGAVHLGRHQRAKRHPRAELGGQAERERGLAGAGRAWCVCVGCVCVGGGGWPGRGTREPGRPPPRPSPPLSPASSSARPAIFLARIMSTTRPHASRAEAAPTKPAAAGSADPSSPSPSPLMWVWAATRAVLAVDATSSMRMAGGRGGGGPGRARRARRRGRRRGEGSAAIGRHPLEAGRRAGTAAGVRKGRECPPAWAAATDARVALPCRAGRAPGRHDAAPAVGLAPRPATDDVDRGGSGGERGTAAACHRAARRRRRRRPAGRATRLRQRRGHL